MTAREKAAEAISIFRFPHLWDTTREEAIGRIECSHILAANWRKNVRDAWTQSELVFRMLNE